MDMLEDKYEIEKGVSAGYISYHYNYSFPGLGISIILSACHME